MVSLTKHLAKAASQRLKGLIVEYDVVCSTLGNKVEEFSSDFDQQVPSVEKNKAAVEPSALLESIQYTFGNLPGFGTCFFK